MPLSSSHGAPPEGSPYAGHIPALDGVRGLAVAAVLLYHLFPATARTPLTRALDGFIHFGANGVDLFFVLSGFLITGILFDTLGAKRYFQTFYARRVLRIFPLYYGVLGFYALRAWLVRVRYDGELLSMALYLQNTHLLAPSVFAYRGPSLPLIHFWSLAIEEQFYLVWPIVIFFVRDRRSLLWICAALTLLCPALRALLWQHGMSYYDVHMNTFLRADSLLAGAALALLLRGPDPDHVLRYAPHLLVFSAFFGLLLVTADRGSSTGPLWRDVLLSLRYSASDLAWFSLLASVLQREFAASICSSAVLRSLGRYSYGIYVLHFPLFSYLQQPIRHLLAVHLTGSKGAGVVLTGLIVFAISWMAAFVSFRFYEQPFLRLRRAFSYGHSSGSRDTQKALGALAPRLPLKRTR